jgi:hypothetical protein
VRRFVLMKGRLPKDWSRGWARAVSFPVQTWWFSLHRNVLKGSFFVMRSFLKRVSFVCVSLGMF